MKRAWRVAAVANGSREREETHSNKKMSLRKRKSMNELDALIFSDEEENDDDKDSEYMDRELSIDPDQVLFTWYSHTKSWDLIEWMLIYSTVSTDFHRTRFRQLRPVLLLLLDLLINFDRGQRCSQRCFYKLPQFWA